MEIKKPSWPWPEYQLLLPPELSGPEFFLHILFISFLKVRVIRVHVPRVPR